MKPAFKTFGEPPTRYCESHRDHGETRGGRYVTNHDGMHRKWICARCLDNAEKRKQAAVYEA